MNKFDKNILVSIRCTVYNHEPYLRKCLDGFVMQKTNFGFEAIVHDDASTDKSAAIIREYAEKYPNIIKPIYETENQYSKHDGSLTRIMDDAMSKSSRYIAFCEGDDYWTDPTKLQKQFDALESHPECTICFCKVDVVSSKGEKLWTMPVHSKIESGVFSLSEFIKEEFGDMRYNYQTSCFFCRASLLSGYREIMKNEFKDFPYGEMPIKLYCLMNGNGYFIPNIMSCYRKFTEGSWTTKRENDKNFALLTTKKLIQSFEKFDEITSKKYHKDIMMRITMLDSRIDILNNDLFKLFLPKYWKIYDYKTFKYYLSLVLKKYLPFAKREKQSK